MEITEAEIRIALPPPFGFVSPDEGMSTDDEHPRQHEEFREAYPCFNSAAAASLRRIGQPRHTETRTRWARGSRLAYFDFLVALALLQQARGISGLAATPCWELDHTTRTTADFLWRRPGL